MAPALAHAALKDVLLVPVTGEGEAGLVSQRGRFLLHPVTPLLTLDNSRLRLDNRYGVLLPAPPGGSRIDPW